MAPKPSLVRLTRSADGTVKLSVPPQPSGRGAYLHGSAACVEAARRRRGLERALGGIVPEDTWIELRGMVI